MQIKRMLTYPEVMETVLNHVAVMEEETVSLENALNRVVSREIISQVNAPYFDNSSMDGYAVISDDFKFATKDNPVNVEILEEIKAGAMPRCQAVHGKVSRIFTGAAIPQGADAVIIQEETERRENRVNIFRSTVPGANIRKAGEDIKAGTVCIPKGKVVTPADMGVIASIGYDTVSVYRRPRVAILATGDELTPAGQPLEPGKIYNSNSYTLIGQILEAGCIPFDIGMVGDNPSVMEERLTSGLKAADMVVTTGGVSVGDYDKTQEVFQALGVTIVFWKMKIKPGKPLLFGVFQGKPVFGVPGNPASSMINFDIVIRPCLLKMSGRERLFYPEVEAVSAQDLRSSGDRLVFLRAVLKEDKEGYLVESAGSQSSGVLSSMSRANALVALPAGKTLVKQGEKVKAIVLDWSFLQSPNQKLQSVS